jgi:hypothetical protein
MARRRYKSDAISPAGHAEKPAEAAATPEQYPLGSEPTPPSPPAPDTTAEPAQHFQSGLAEQIRQQRAYAEQHALQQYIASNFLGALPHEAQWLMANPHHLSNPPLVHAAAQIAAQRGIPRQDPQFLHFVGQLLDQHAAAQMQPAPAPRYSGAMTAGEPPVAGPMPAPPTPPMPAHTHIDVEKTEYDGEPESASVSVHHVSAPVSRDSGHYAASGEYEPGEGSRVTLSKAEREHAEAAGVSVEEYAKQKLRMMKLKKAKVIKDE